MAEGLGMSARGSIAPLHGRQPAHFWLHGVPRCTLWYAELKLRRNAWDPLTNIPADAAIPVIFVVHGSMYSFICLPSERTQKGSSTSFFGTRRSGTKLVGLKPGGQYSRVPEIMYLQIVRYDRVLSSSTDFRLGWLQCATPCFTVGK